ncbi:unnamed protein product [Microthlaspi erraticum]|uniref:Reverse transcriptase Ty1/copia-type domain-containing protein n=1 Tax=Microthlaspi erraticum TaxID=1685480 RepID=A0A6D2HKS0_9BRAS|nr:unnamed protein product [Microthlaspi erraticum]
MVQANMSKKEGDYDRASLPQLSDDQWTSLLSFLSSKKQETNEKLNGKTESGEFIIDTGASHHMTWDIDLLSNVTNIPACPIGLPDGDSPLAWKTKKQDTVSFSSAEAEYRAMAFTTRELKWNRELLSCFGISHPQAMHLYCDNKAALHIAANPVFHERTKHIERDCHYIRDEIIKGSLTTSHVRTTEQLADIFTKALGSQQFSYLRRKLGIRDLHAPT